MKLHFRVLHPMWKCYQDLRKFLNKILIKIPSYLLRFLQVSLQAFYQPLTRSYHDLTRFYQDITLILQQILQKFHQDLPQILPGC